MKCPNCSSTNNMTLNEKISGQIKMVKKCVTCETIFEDKSGKILREGKELLIEVNPSFHVF